MIVVSFIILPCALSAHAAEEFAFRTKYLRTADLANRTIVATKCDHAPKLDGTLNDPLWSQAGKTASAFTNFPSVEPCGRQSVAYCCYDDSALYISFDCEEPELDQQQIDNKNILAADHVGVYLEVGDTRGRGARCSVIGNRAGFVCSGAWREHEPKLHFECKAGPNRWYVQMAIPFKYLSGIAGAPLRGEVWGIKFTRYGKNTETGAARMRSCWPHIPTISEDVVTYNANLCFSAENMLENAALAGKQQLTVRPGTHYALDWSGETPKGAVSILVEDKPFAAQDLSKTNRLDFTVPKGVSSIAVDLKLEGGGAPPAFHLKPILDDVPANWICLTNNDWVPERNLKNRNKNASEGAYTYLKTPMHDFGTSPYRSLGAPDLDAKEMPEKWRYIGRPTRKPLDAPPPRPDIGEEEFENFPFEVIYQDGAVPEFVGLPSGSFDVGGMQGWIPFSKGSLTGDESWAGWPVDRWSSASPHDIVLDFKDKYYIRRIDIQQINTGVRNLEILVRGSGNPTDSFVPVYRFNGPGTQRSLATSIPVYFSQTGLDSVAQQLRLSLGIFGAWGNGAAVSFPNLGRPNCQVGLFGVAEIWVWAEPKGEHNDSEVNVFKVQVPDSQKQPPLKFEQLRKLPEPVIWPRPKELIKADGRFAIGPNTAIVCATGGQLSNVARWLQAEIKQRFCENLPIKSESEIAPTESAIRIGVKGISAAFDALCAAEKLDEFNGPQSYRIRVTPSQVVIAASDFEGAGHGIRTLIQWMEHDEKAACLRAVSIRDWPVLQYRTLVPSSDHRRLLLPLENNPSNYYTIVNGVSYLRYNSMIDWLPTSIYENEAKTREMLHYASDRFTDFRPALWVQKVPGDCIEANPDDQPSGGAGIQNSDGTWESDNLCPSNPQSYLAIEKFLDSALRTHDTSRFIEVGFMGSVGKTWNVCRLCRKRGLAGYELYGDFMNKVDALCRARNRSAIFTNAIMYSDAVQRASVGRDLSSAFDSVNHGVAMRFDRPAGISEILHSGFWTISKPWDTPTAVNSGGRYTLGGKAYFDTVPATSESEGAITIGERCDYEWWWRAEICSRGLLTADAFWNGTAPETGPERSRYEQQAANACVRFNERVSTGIEYPSWRTGMTPRFFSIDIHALCNRSHIDDGTASGPSRSGPREGANGFGAAIDFRRIPMGKQEFADIPFEVIDPAQNNWKSMLVVGSGKKEALIPGIVNTATVPVGRKAASFCVLRSNLRTVFRAGQTSHYWNILQPAYVFEYSDGSRCVCDWETRRHFDDISNQCFYYGGKIGPSVLSHMLPSSRLGFAANTLSGAGANVFVSEIVNPYPEKEIRNLLIQLPNPEERDYTFEFHDAIFAITGVEPVEWDTKYWSRQPPKSLLPANAIILLDAKKLAPQKFNSPEVRGKLAARMSQCTLAQPANLAAISFRLRMPGRDSNPMSVRNRHADCKVLVSKDLKAWKEVAHIKGCTGLDGEHVLVFPSEICSGLKIEMDASAYTDEDNADFGLLACDLYEVKQ